MEFRRHTLANGLEVVAECDSEARSLALGYFVKTGARDETTEISGVSHFLEHMVFKGTPRRTAEDVNREFDEMGAHYNAFTSEEKTVYYAAVLPEQQDQALDLLSDIIRPSLREEDFTTEKKVILEEIKMYEDQPPYGADDKCRALHYGDHPLGKSVLGTIESIEALPVEAMRKYFEYRYSPGNISLVAAGAVDFDQLVREVERHCGAWAPFNAPRALDKPRATKQFAAFVKESSAQQYVMQLANGPMATDLDRFPAKLLATILGDDSGSRLYWEFVDPGLLEHASISHHDYDGAGIFISYLSGDPEGIEECIARLAELYADVEAKGIRIEELEQAKNKINSRIVLGSERPRGRLFNLGANWVHRREYRSIKDDLDAVEAVTVADIARVLKQYPLTQSTTVTIGPLTDVKAPR